MLPRWLRIAIAVLVTCAWAVNEVLVLAFPARGDTSLGPLFMVVVGATFASSADLGSARKRIGLIIAGTPEPEPQHREEPDGDE